MKLRDLAKGNRAVKAVPFRLANAPDAKPVPPGDDVVLDEWTVLIGVRVLTGNEIADVYEKAEADARRKGVKEWLDTHPLCRLYEMVHLVAAACVDVPARAEPFFASAAEVLIPPEVCEDNIAYLYEQQRAWQDECSLRSNRPLSVTETMALLAQEAERPENAQTPFSHLRAASQPSFFHTTALLFQNLLTLSALSTSSDDTSLPTSSSERESVEPNPDQTSPPTE